MDAIAALAAQHVVDLFEADCACECPRCCLACRAVQEVTQTAGLHMASQLTRLGVEGHIWQDSRGGFDSVMIKTKWHDPCPVYEELQP